MKEHLASTLHDMLSIDIETYCDLPLKKVGVYRYADHESFEILLIAYAFGDEPIQLIDLAQGDEIPERLLKALTDPLTTKSAFNANFERVCLSRHLNIELPPQQWHCSMIHAWTLGLSGGLDDVAKAINLPQDKQKMYVGKNLIRLFSVPRPVTKNTSKQAQLIPTKDAYYRYYPKDKPKEWALFRQYCIQDVVVEREICKKLNKFPVSDNEMELWYLDQQINDYGVRLDMDFVHQAIKLSAMSQEHLTEEYKKLTGLENPNSDLELKLWLSKRLGFKVTSLDKRALPALFEKAKHDSVALKAITLRQELSKTSISKYNKMVDVICSDGRARGLLQFYGASRTGRWSGRLIQVQNLPRNNLSDLGLARQIVKEGDLELLELLYPSALDVLSQLIRTAFIPSKGHRFIVSDFSSIEARIIAWYAGEHWRMEVFNTHGKIYEASAAQMFNVPVKSIDKGSPLRQKGKIAELALGYQGGVGALKSMGALEMGLEEDELAGLVQQWRAANLNIVQFWHEVDNAVKTAISEKTVIRLQHGLNIIYHKGALFIDLPSGRRLTYPNPRVEPHHEFENAIKITFDGKENGKRGRVDTYGGKLVENIVQATARDCLAVGLMRLHQAGYQIVMHIHDEVVLDVPIGFGSVEEVNEILSEDISWAPGLKLGADGFEAEYYRKDD